jgi:hypothetical protein
MYIEFGMAQKYVDDLSRNVKNGLKTKVQNGWYPGVAPGGYWRKSWAAQHAPCHCAATAQNSRLRPDEA